MAYIGVLCVPTLMLIIIGYGLIKGFAVYDMFVEGAKEGLVTCLKVFPSLLGLISSVEMLRASGILDFLMKGLSELAIFSGFPVQTLPLMLMRPISGSGALAIVTDLFKNFSPDSFPGLCASVMMGSTETTFYTIAVYYGAAGIKKIRHTANAALVADFVGMIGSVIVVRLLLV